MGLKIPLQKKLTTQWPKRNKSSLQSKNIFLRQWRPLLSFSRTIDAVLSQYQQLPALPTQHYSWNVKFLSDLHIYCVFLRISAKVISTLAEKMPTLTLSVPSNPTHSLQHLLFETLQNCQHCTHKATEREGEGLSKNKERE